MWNSFDTGTEQGIAASVITFPGGKDDRIHAYVAQPDGTGPYPGIVLVHHLPGWDDFYRETAVRLANYGYAVICPDLYCRNGHGGPEEVAAAVRADGGAYDDDVVADCEAAMRWLRALPSSNGKVGIVGTCSGGRHAVLVASRVRGFDAVVDLWGGGVVAPADALTPQRPVAPLDYTNGLEAPLLGIFGNDDKAPSPSEVDIHEAKLREHGKDYEFHRYDGAGHGFFYYDRPIYRPKQAMDAWGKVFAFFRRHLQS